MFKGGSYNKAHWYLVYNNKKDGVYAKQITHLYVPDPKRFEQVRKGYLIKAYVKGFVTPQGIKSHTYYSSADGNKLTIVDIDKNETSSIKGRGYVRLIK